MAATASDSTKEAMADDAGHVSMWTSGGVMAFNVVVTVGLIVTNKALFTNFGFEFAPTLLLTLHQSTCAVGSYLSSPSTSGGIEPSTSGSVAARVAIATIVLTRIFGNVLVNLSLKYNTVGMYQLYKILTVPSVFIGELLFMDAPFRMSIALTLLLLLVGVAMATVNDVSFSFIGAVCGFIAPVLTAANQLTIKYIQAKHKIVGNDLLKVVAPWVVLLQLFIIPITDDIFYLPTWLGTAGWESYAMVILSCLLVWGLEWSLVTVVHYTSAMTIQVLGHLKTMLIMGAGIVLFHNPMTSKGAYGVAIALFAVGLYTYLKSQQRTMQFGVPFLTIMVLLLGSLVGSLAWNAHASSIEGQFKDVNSQPRPASLNGLPRVSPMELSLAAEARLQRR